MPSDLEVDADFQEYVGSSPALTQKFFMFAKVGEGPKGLLLSGFL